MSDVIDWSKAPEGATQYVINSAGPWEKIEDGKLYYWYRGDWLKLPWRGDDSCSTLKIVKRPQPAPWSGEGLAPVGTALEVLHETYGWIGAKVVGQDGSATIVRTNDGYAGVHPHEFRPIRTQEQIAADERNHAISAIVAQSLGRCDSIGAAYLYDAGYRKP